MIFGKHFEGSYQKLEEDLRTALKQGPFPSYNYSCSIEAVFSGKVVVNVYSYPSYSGHNGVPSGKETFQEGLYSVPYTLDAENKVTLGNPAKATLTVKELKEAMDSEECYAPLSSSLVEAGSSSPFFRNLVESVRPLGDFSPKGLRPFNVRKVFLRK